ncbi:MAG: hypothetical protein M3131_09760 [Actinomycetota bacterium]|nr:hypothetical protein [Actinomycetota bacterium]
MTTRRARVLLACALVLGATGCGSADAGEGGPDPNDKRAVALACMRDDEGLEARPVGEKSIQVNGPGGPRVEFTVSTGEAEGRQFQGEAQAAEQIGPALLFVNRGTEEQLEKVETCLQAQ